MPDRGRSELLSMLREPISVEGHVFYNAGSIGVVLGDPQYTRPEDLLRDADIAMYEAKRRGRDCYVVFDATMRHDVAAESALEHDLRRAVLQHEFITYYQPIVDAASSKIVSFEALVRWRRPGAGLVNAAEFIGHAERRGLVDAIDNSVLEDACRDAARLFRDFPGTTIAVNISAVHLMAENLADSVWEVMHRHGVSPERIRLEVTETAVMHNAEQARTTLYALRDRGIKIVLDDFGAGYSSLAYLHRLPIAGVKIDGSFIARLPGDKHALAIVRSVVALARSLGLYTVAEGVEMQEQLESIKTAGVDQAQGFFFSEAQPVDSLGTAS